MALRYISLADLVNEIPVTLQASLTDDTPNSASKVDAIITQKGEAAEQELESYLSGRYNIPLEATDGTIPASVKQAIFIITKYYLYGRRDSIDAGIQSQYDSTISWLKAVSRGDANINLIKSDGTVESQGGLLIQVSDEETSQFSRFV